MNDIPMRLVSGRHNLQIGDFYWDHIGWKSTIHCEHSAHLHVVIPPRPEIKARYEVFWVPVSVNGGDRAEDRRWNGDWDKPTVAGSWGIQHFHFWVRDGVMTLKEPK